MKYFWLENPIFYDLIQVLATGGFLRKIIPYLKFTKNKSVLDLGCGTGTLAKYLSFSAYTGIDINKEFIKIAKKRFPQHRFEIANVIDEKLPKGSFDYVIIMDVLHHLTDKEIKKLFSKLKSSKNIHELIIIEARPSGLLGNLLGRLDAGSNFRDFDNLNQIISKYFKQNKIFYEKAPFLTYDYLITRCLL